MIIVDTSVWIDHIRRGNAELVAMIGEGRMLQHPFVTAELALGSIPDRQRFCERLGRLPQAQPMESGVLLDFIAERELYGTGIGIVDAHLLASAALLGDAVVWAIDKRLVEQAGRLGIVHESA